MKLLFALIAAASLGGAQTSDPPPKSDQPADEADAPDEFRAVMRAAFAFDRLWVLTDDGKLVTIRSNDQQPTPVDLPEPVKDLCIRQGAPLAVTANRKSDEWTVSRYDGRGWKWVATIPFEDEGLVALNCTGRHIAVLTNDRLIELIGGSTREVALSERLRRGRVTSTALAVDGSLFVGLNAGEWGGGLKRIDRRSGRITTIQRNATGDLCDGPLNTDCDPVHAVAVEPWKPDCVVAAVGLVHFLAHGRLVEVCGKTVESLYAKPFDDGWTKPDENGNPGSTVAFFGLSGNAKGLVAIGLDGLYRLDGRGEPKFVPLPKFQNVGGYWVSFDLPDAILVLTDINRRASISGSVPMLVMRR